MMTKLIKTIPFLFSFTLLAHVHAQAIEGIAFAHHDWELVCDNTGYCQAAGYQTYSFDDSDFGASILLMRQAGANQPVTGLLQLQDTGDENNPSSVELWIGNKKHGVIRGQNTNMSLTSAQVQALLNTAKTDQSIQLISGDDKCTLSNQGMSAVFLKMDEFQQRLGTTGAIIRKGTQSEAHVLKPQPAPTLTIPKTLEADTQLKTHYMSQSAKILRLTQKDFDANCGYEEDELDLFPLSTTQALVSRNCWFAAYNMGTAYWLVDKDLTSAQLITSDGTYYEKGEISSSHKGRGIGDCWGGSVHTWDGTAFILTSSYTTGMCRGQAGGYWHLDSIAYHIKQLNLEN